MIASEDLSNIICEMSLAWEPMCRDAWKMTIAHTHWCGWHNRPLELVWFFFGRWISMNSWNDVARCIIGFLFARSDKACKGQGEPFSILTNRDTLNGHCVWHNDIAQDPTYDLAATRDVFWSRVWQSPSSGNEHSPIEYRKKTFRWFGGRLEFFFRENRSSNDKRKINFIQQNE